MRGRGFRGPKPVKNGKKIIPMRNQALDRKLFLGQATPLESRETLNLEFPHYKALTEREREIYLLRMAGLRLAEIGEVTGLAPHDLSRIIKGTKEKFEYLVRFRESLQDDAISIMAFLAGMDVFNLCLSLIAASSVVDFAPATPKATGRQHPHDGSH